MDWCLYDRDLRHERVKYDSGGSSLKADSFPDVWGGADENIKSKEVLVASIIPREYHLRRNVKSRRMDLSSPELFFFNM